MSQASDLCVIEIVASSAFGQARALYQVNFGHLVLVSEADPGNLGGFNFVNEFDGTSIEEVGKVIEIENDQVSHCGSRQPCGCHACTLTYSWRTLEKNEIPLGLTYVSHELDTLMAATIGLYKGYITLKEFTTAIPMAVALREMARYDDGQLYKDLVAIHVISL